MKPTKKMATKKVKHVKKIVEDNARMILNNVAGGKKVGRNDFIRK